ncbi:hypothetical protein J3458_022103 [Metarhizium acridum]|uniref:uncharacterized protein n=1 Tax=Metarhizium acridum TaxID=92637 RepID=UPI001C6CD1A3|nr:hypothetical protein J3458_022103 [Metarhizium acridum]
MASDVPEKAVVADESVNHAVSKEVSHQRRVSLVENIEGEIENPLRDIPRDELLEKVNRFHKDKGLPEDILPLLKKGALVAQNPADFEAIEDLDESDKAALREETTHRWKQPWPLYYTIILNSIAAAIQGWDQVNLDKSAQLCRPTVLT